MTQHVFDHRVVALRGLSNRRSGAHEVGSGYVVAPGLVLTCRHVLDNIEGLIEFRAIGDTQWSEASRQVTIGGLDANGWITQQRHPLGGGSPDVALLKIGTGTSDLESAASAGAVQPVKWGKVVLDEPVTPTGDGVRALGFPIERIKEAGRPMARPSRINAAPLDAVEGASDGVLIMTIEGGGTFETADAPGEVNGAVAPDSAWAGISGSAVFHDDLLVGVISHDPSPNNNGPGKRLWVTPTAFLLDSDTLRTALAPEQTAPTQVLPNMLQAVDRPVAVVRDPKNVGFTDLKAAEELVTFTGRTDELGHLLTWASPNDGDAATAVPGVRLATITGPGGAGKTRLARELCHRMADRGWVTGFLSMPSASTGRWESGFPRQVTSEVLAGTTPRLIVVDYAASLASIVAELITTPVRCPVRILLCDRPEARLVTGLSQALKLADHDAEHLHEDRCQVALDPLTTPGIDRSAFFRAAVQDLGGEFLEDAPATPADDAAERSDMLRAWLANDTFNNTMMILIAALLTATGELAPGAPISSASLLGRAILREDERFWRPKLRTLADRIPAGVSDGFRLWAGHAADDDAKSFDLRLRSVATAAMTRATTGRATDLLVTIPDVTTGTQSGSADATDRANHLRRWLIAFSPDQERLSDFGPDPVAEAIIEFSLDPRHLSKDAPATFPEGVTETWHRWLLGPDSPSGSAVAAGRGRGLFAELDAQEQDSALAVLTRACRRAPVADVLLRLLNAHAETWVDRALVDATYGTDLNLSMALQTLGQHYAAGELLKSTICQAVLARDDDARAPLSRSLLVVSEWRVHQLRQAAPKDGGKLAGALNNLAVRLSEVGRREEALQPATQAANLYRTLAEQNPAAYNPDLASALNNLAVRLSGVGRRDEALQPATEAVQLRRKLAEQNPAAYNPDLASALNNLAVRLSEVGRRDETLQPATEAANLYRTLAEQNPAAYNPDLAMALNTLAIGLSEVGRRDNALQHATEAVQLRRELAEQNPAAHNPGLAMALNTLAVRLSEVGRRDEALQPATEAANLYRTLAEQNPAAYNPGLAGALNDLAIGLSEVGRRDEALQPATEAANLYRTLAEQNPTAYNPDLAGALNNLAIGLSEVGRRDDALQPATEAVQLRRTLAEQNPAAHNPNLATTLIVMALRLAEADRSVEGVIAAREALQLVLPTAQRYPAAFQGLAMSIARDYVQLCQQAEAEPDLDLLRQAAAILTEG